MTAAETVLRSILKKNNLTSTYYYVGDPEFPRLAQLFGPSTVKVECSSGVIVISDTTAPLGEGTLSLPASPTVEGSDSVCSPLTTNTPKLRRKLFRGEGCNVGSRPANEATEVFYMPNHDGDLVPRCANVNPSKPKRNTLKPSASPHASSCGSTSPMHGGGAPSSSSLSMCGIVVYLCLISWAYVLCSDST
ncbi:hypothetical protein AAHA92_10243 [Salvia divinorum]|uniref:Uncharacterized protein n=1 Tax=Salvia divinorum TaxID=28513 RepID=A0ABD1HUX1_SALDI